jgi:hypothetical protein
LKPWYEDLIMEIINQSHMPSNICTTRRVNDWRQEYHIAKPRITL